MPINGYQIKKTNDGWAIIDVYKEEPLVLDGHPQTGLTEREAKKLLGELNQQNLETHLEWKSGRVP